MGANKRTVSAIKSDRCFIAKELLKSTPYRHILTELNTRNVSLNKGYTLSLAMIVYDIKALHEEWRVQYQDLISTFMFRELAKLEKMEYEAWEAWEASKNKKTKNTFIVNRKGDSKKEDGQDLIKTVTETSNGNASYLDRILKCMDKRQALLGYGSEIIGNSEEIGVPIVYMDAKTIERERERLFNNFRKIQGVKPSK